MGVILQVERDRAAIVQRHGHACRRDVLNRSERSVLYPQAALVAQEHDPVAGCEGALAPFGTDGNIFTKFAARSEAHTSKLQSLMRNSYAVFCLKTTNENTTNYITKQKQIQYSH